VHLLTIFSLEISGTSIVGEGSPTFGLYEPLCIILWVYLRTLEAHQLHSAAIDIAHGLPQSSYAAAFCAGITKRKDNGADPVDSVEHDLTSFLKQADEV
jgi:hypothetical protein